MMTTTPEDPHKAALRRLGLFGLLAHWQDVRERQWLPELIHFEQTECQRRSLDRRLRFAKLGTFKPLCDFDWAWPNKIDRAAVEELCSLDFLAEAANVVLIGPNSSGKTTIAKNLTHLALLAGHSARFTTANAMINDLAAQSSTTALNRRLRQYCRPSLLIVDEIGLFSYDGRQADLLYEVVSRRHQQRSTIVTTTRPFAEWNQIFPNATSVVAIVERLIHKAEVLTIDAHSYCLKEAKERAATKAKARSRKQRTPERA